jgi:hypothetical protein
LNELGRPAQEEKEKENRRKEKECNGAGVKDFRVNGFGHPGRASAL